MEITIWSQEQSQIVMCYQAVKQVGDAGGQMWSSQLSFRFTRGYNDLTFLNDHLRRVGRLCGRTERLALILAPLRNLSYQALINSEVVHLSTLGRMTYRELGSTWPTPNGVATMNDGCSTLKLATEESIMGQYTSGHVQVCYWLQAERRKQSI